MRAHGGRPEASPPEVPLAVHGVALRELLTYPEWVYRRVEQISFIDDQSVRRRVSVDFQLPAWYADGLDRGRHRWLAPLALLKKEPMVGFDLRDEEGAVLPLLGSEESQLVVTAALITTADTILEDQGLALDVAVQRDLEHIAGCGLGEADLAVANLFEGKGSRPSRNCLRRVPLMKSFVEDMAHNFPLLTTLEDPQRRRVMKFSYLEELPAPTRSFTRALGWESSTFVFPLVGIGMGRSYHCEIGAPEELEIHHAELVSVTGREGGQTTYDRTQACGEWVHLQAGNVSSDATGALISDLRAPFPGMPTSSVVLALGVSVLLTVGAVFHERIAGSAEPATAILLTLPAGIAAYLARPAHQLSRRLVRGIRLLNWGIAILVFLAAATMTVGREHDGDDVILIAWSSLAAVSWTITLVLALSATLPYLRQSPRRGGYADGDW